MSIWYLLSCYLVWLAIVSLFTIGLYGWDKRQAVLGRWRVPEQRLHWMSLVGGWPGAIIGQRFFRHKTQKRAFKLMIWIAGVVHAMIFAAIVYLHLYR